MLIPEDQIEPRLYDIPGAVVRSGLSRSRIYDAMRSGALVSIRVGKRRLIPAEALEAYLDSLIAEAA